MSPLYTVDPKRKRSVRMFKGFRSSCQRLTIAGTTIGLLFLCLGCSATEESTDNLTACSEGEPYEVGPYTVHFFDSNAAPPYTYPNLSARLEESVVAKAADMASSTADDRVYHEDVTAAANDPGDLALRPIPEPCLPADCEGFLWTDAHYLAVRNVHALLVARRVGPPGSTSDSGRIALPAFGAVALSDQRKLITQSFAV